MYFCVFVCLGMDVQIKLDLSWLNRIIKKKKKEKKGHSSRCKLVIE